MLLTSFEQGHEEHIHYSAVTFRHLLDSLARPGKLNQLEYPTCFGPPPSYYSSSAATNIPLNFYALGALTTLLDGETCFALAADNHWLDHTAPAVQWLTLRSSASLSKPDIANFAFFCERSHGRLLTELHIGSLLEPEFSATAFYCVERLTEPDRSHGDDRSLRHGSKEVDSSSMNGKAPPCHAEPQRSICLAHRDASLRLSMTMGDRCNCQGPFVQIEPCLSLELSGPGIQESRVINVVGLDQEDMRFIWATRRSYPLGIDIYLIDATGQCLGLPRTTKIHVRAA